MTFAPPPPLVFVVDVVLVCSSGPVGTRETCVGPCLLTAAVTDYPRYTGMRWPIYTSPQVLRGTSSPYLHCSPWLYCLLCRPCGDPRPQQHAAVGRRRRRTHRLHGQHTPARCHLPSQRGFCCRHVALWLCIVLETAAPRIATTGTPPQTQSLRPQRHPPHPCTLSSTGMRFAARASPCAKGVNGIINGVDSCI